MKRASLILLVLLTPLLLGNRVANKTAGGGGITYLLNENFEGTGLPSGWGATGSVNWDYTTTALQGSQSLLLSAINTDGYSPLFTLSTTLDGYFKFQTNDINPGGSYRRLATLYGASDANTVVVQIFLTLTGQLRIGAEGGVLATTTDTISNNTTVHVWWHYVSGSGSNGTVNIAWSTDGTRPTSGNKFAQSTAYTGTVGIRQVSLEQYTGAAPTNQIYDRVLASVSTIPDNP